MHLQWIYYENRFNDISNNIVIAELSLCDGIHTTNTIGIYVEDTKGNNLMKEIYLNNDFTDSDDFVFSNVITNDISKDQCILIDQNPIVYARLRQNTESKEGQ